MAAYFLTAIALICIIGFAMSVASRRREQLRTRLIRAAGAQDVETTPEREDSHPDVFPWIAWMLKQLGVYERIDQLLRRIDAPLTAGEFVASLITLWIAGPLIAWSLGQPPLLSVGVMALSVLAPRLAFTAKLALKKKHFADQMPDALDMMSSSIRVGHGLQRAMQLVASQGEDPIAGEFRRALADIQLGSPVDTALQRIGDRVGSKEMGLLANVVGIQMQIGGNMAEIMDRVGVTLREREELRNEVKSLTAEGKMTAMVCMAMPPLMGLFEYWMNPDYMKPLLTTQIGHIMIGSMVVMQLLGGVVIKKMMKLE